MRSTVALLFLVGSLALSSARLVDSGKSFCSSNNNIIIIHVYKYYSLTIATILAIIDHYSPCFACYSNDILCTSHVHVVLICTSYAVLMEFLCSSYVVLVYFLCTSCVLFTFPSGFLSIGK